MIRVFVSSVSKDFEDIRQQIIEDLRTANYDTANMEIFGARPESPLDVCLQEIRTADVIVVIIGPRYGSLIPNGDVSYTHEEYREARRHGIPVLVFRVPDAQDLGEDESARLRRFLEEAASAVTYDPACSPDRLSARIQASLQSARNRGELGPRFRLFQHWKQFFAIALSEQSTSLFNHRGPFIGREEYLDRIVNFARGEGSVLLLKASGGAGKSRLLLEAAKILETGPDGLPALFGDPGADWNSQDINLLPSEPTVLVLDDAHRRVDLERFLNACFQRNQQLRVILSCRPSAVELVRDDLAGFRLGEPLELPKLSREDAESLAVHSLGDAYKHLAGELVTIAHQNPLVIRIGGECIRKEHVSPELLASTPEEFTRVVMGKLLRDPVFDEPLSSKLLETIAGVGPISAEDSGTHERLASFHDVKPRDVVGCIARLEQAGYLQRRGRLLRVSPDVLADHLMHRAAVAVNGRSTGFVEDILEAFASDHLGNILSNASELDWRAAQTQAHAPVLTDTWTSLASQLLRMTHRERSDLLENLHRAALFDPENVLRICESAIEHPAPADDPELERFGYGYTARDVNTKALELIGFIATHPDYTQRCMVRLWPFAVADERPLNSNPGHPRRRIQDLLKYNRRLHDRVRNEAFEVVRSRLDDDARADEIPWAVAAIGMRLAREVEETSSTGATMTFTTYGLAPYYERIIKERRAAIECLDRVARGSRPREASEALDQLAELLRRPRGMFGREVGRSEVDAWIPEAQDMLRRLASIAAEPTPEVTRYLARRKLRQVRPEHWPELSAALKKALQDAPPVADEQLYDLLLGAPMGEEFMDWRAENERTQQLCREVAKTLWSVHGDPETVVTRIAESASHVSEYVSVRGGQISGLVAALIEERPAQSEQFVRVLAKCGNLLPLGVMPSALHACVHGGSRQIIVRLVREFAESDLDDFRVSVAHSLRFILGQDPAHSADDLGLLSLYLHDACINVRRAALQAAASFDADAVPEIVGMVMDVEWSDDVGMAETICEIFDPRHGIDPAQLLDEQVDELLRRIERLPTLSGHRYGVHQFISYASGRRPESTVRMLLERVRKADTTDPGTWREERYKPIPYAIEGLQLSGLAESSMYLDLLRMIRDAMLDYGVAGRYWLRHLFRVAVPDINAGLPVLREFVVSGDPARIQAAAYLLREFDHAAIFDLPEFVGDLLDAASAVSSDCKRITESELYALAISGVYSGTPGMPAPRHLEDRRRAQELAEQFSDRPLLVDFYTGLIRHANECIERERLDWETQGIEE